ncbi:MAG: hypothetical protein HIU81_02605, partial [Acidobacteria bacterium]|nr:hypothetical protein [Acidobacteriota bacterium]
MSTRESIARHRAEVTKTSPIAVIAKNITNNAGGMGRQAVVIAAASGLVLTSGMAANAAQPAAHVSDSNTASVKSSGVVDMPIKASTEAAVAASLVQPLDITSSPKPAPVVRQVAPAATKAAPLAQTVASKAAPTAAQVAPAAATPKVTASGVGATILAAAYA